MTRSFLDLYLDRPDDDSTLVLSPDDQRRTLVDHYFALSAADRDRWYRDASEEERDLIDQERAAIRAALLGVVDAIREEAAARGLKHLSSVA